jgi:uridylate kinase
LQSTLRYQSVLLKLSGEALKGQAEGSYDSEVMGFLARQISEVYAMGVHLGIVVGGGNLFRGIQGERSWLPRGSADAIGMMATMMNGLALQALLRHHRVPCALFSALAMPGVIPGFDLHAFQDALEQRHVLIFAGGTGHPYVSTDTASAFRAKQMGAEILIKATQVDGVYTADPKKDPHAKRFETLTYLDLLERDLRVMDATSVSFCKEYAIPILVCDVAQAGILQQAVQGEPVGTLIAHATDAHR